MDDRRHPLLRLLLFLRKLIIKGTIFFFFFKENYKLKSCCITNAKVKVAYQQKHQNILKTHCLGIILQLQENILPAQLLRIVSAENSPIS